MAVFLELHADDFDLFPLAIDVLKRNETSIYVSLRVTVSTTTSEPQVTVSRLAAALLTGTADPYPGEEDDNEPAHPFL